MTMTNGSVKEVYVLEELLALNDADFVRAIYRAILMREPDSSGKQNYLRLLREGHDKLILIRDMSLSDEAKRAGVVVPGLEKALRRRRLGSMPLVGALLRGLMALASRPRDRDAISAFHNQSIGMAQATFDVLVRFQTAAVEQQNRLEVLIGRIAERQENMTQIIVAMHKHIGPLSDHQDQTIRSLMQVSQLSGAGAFGEGPDGIAAALGDVRTAARRLDAPSGVQLQLTRKAGAWKT